MSKLDQLPPIEWISSDFPYSEQFKIAYQKLVEANGGKIPVLNCLTPLFWSVTPLEEQPYTRTPIFGEIMRVWDKEDEASKSRLQELEGLAYEHEIRRREKLRAQGRIK